MNTIYSMPTISTTTSNTKMTAARANKLPLHRRPLFASLTTPVSIMEDEELGIQGYSRVKISRLGRQQRNARPTLDQYRSASTATNVSAASLRATVASAITRKQQQQQQRTLAQELMMEDEEAEADELFALLSSKTCATVLSPAPTPVMPAFAVPILPPGLPAFGAFPGAFSLPTQESPRPSSRGSSVDSFDFGFSDDEESLCASSESSFDHEFGVKQAPPVAKPQLSISIPNLYTAPAPINVFDAPKFVPPQVRRNIEASARPWSHTSSPSTSSISSASSTSSWRTSSSRASISSASSVSSYASAHSAIPASTKPAYFVATKPAPAPTPAKANGKTEITKYIYQGGVSTVVGGGVMLGAAKPKFQAKQPQLPQQQQAKYRAPIGGARRFASPAAGQVNNNGGSPSWRRGSAVRV